MGIPATRSSHELVSSYLTKVRDDGRTESTLRSYRSTLGTYVHDVDPVTVTTEGIELWLDSRPLGPRARFTYISTLAGFHRWLVRRGVRGDNPVDDIERPRVPRRPPQLASERDVRLIFQAPPRLRCWYLLAAYAGLKVREIAELRVENVDLRATEPYIRVPSRRGTARTVPLTPSTVEALNDHGVPNEGLVFPALDCNGRSMNRPLTAGAVSQIANLWLREHGIASTMHQLRHWFGASLIAQNHDVLLAQTLLGHADPATTARYAELAATAEAVAAIRRLEAAPFAPCRSSLRRSPPWDPHESGP